MVILLTGASGFLGKHVVTMLSQAHQIISLGRSNRNLIVADITTKVPEISIPVHCVVHAAGKAHFAPDGAISAQEFFDLNVNGTKNLCKALEAAPKLPAFFVFISSVAVYGRDEGQEISEAHPLNASSAYGKSKIEAELYLRKWCAEFNVHLSILRLPIIAGVNPPGNLGAMIRGIRSGWYFSIDKGQARKSIVHANDVARLIPALYSVDGIYNLTDGYHPSVAEVEQLICRTLARPEPKELSRPLAEFLAFAGDFLGPNALFNSAKLQKITSTLTFDDSLARAEINWSPTPVLDSFIF